MKTYILFFSKINFSLMQQGREEAYAKIEMGVCVGSFSLHQGSCCYVKVNVGGGLNVKLIAVLCCSKALYTYLLPYRQFPCNNILMCLGEPPPFFAIICEICAEISVDDGLQAAMCKLIIEKRSNQILFGLKHHLKHLL